MPSYDYRCKSCDIDITLERSMTDETQPHCSECGGGDLTRVWSVFIMSGGSKPDVGQGTGGRSAPRKSGCGSCSTHSCGTCH